MASRGLTWLLAMRKRGEAETSSVLGLPLHYQVHPVVLAMARIPRMEDAEA